MIKRLALLLMGRGTLIMSLAAAGGMGWGLYERTAAQVAHARADNAADKIALIETQRAALADELNRTIEDLEVVNVALNDELMAASVRIEILDEAVAHQKYRAETNAKNYQAAQRRVADVRNKKITECAGSWADQRYPVTLDPLAPEVQQ